MSDLLVPVPIGALEDVWVEVLEHRLTEEISEALPGQCLRFEGLPRGLLEHLARAVNLDSAGAEIYLVDRVMGPETWRVGVHKVVERRNAEEGIVVALFPPDVQLAAGDSVDVSTFRAVPTHDLAARVQELILQRIPEDLRSSCSEILSYLDLKGWKLSTSSRLKYLLTIASQPSSSGYSAGAALYVLGLIPDFALLERPGEFHYRLGQRNLPTVGKLQDQAGTNLERVLRIPLSDRTFRRRLLALFSQVSPERVATWGALVATNQEWRHLALDQWPLADAAPPPGQLRIDVSPLKLPRRDDGVLLYEQGTKVSVAWETSPPPLDVPGLAYFRIELLSSDRVVTWESSLFKSGTGKTAKRSRTIKDLGQLDSGVYFFRVIALNDVGDPFPPQELRDPEGDQEGKRTNETEDFLLLVTDELIETEDVEAIANIGARSFPEAEMLARWSAIRSGKDLGTVHPQAVAWATPLDASTEGAVAMIRFDLQRQYSVKLSQRLRRIEHGILTHPQDGGHRKIRLDRRYVEPETLTLDLPHDFSVSRERVFERIVQTALEDYGVPVVALADLCSLDSLIEEYARSYEAWLATGDPSSLLVDLTLVDVPDHGRAALLSPTHPLRLLWFLQEQELGRAWSHQAAERNDAPPEILDEWRTRLAPELLPAVVVTDCENGYLDAGGLPGGWGAYLPSRLRDSRSLLSLLRSRLGSGAAHQSEADVPPRMLADKLEAFLMQHPYTPVLILNVINPGDAALIVDALVELERRQRTDVNYEVRLFTDSASPAIIGSAFRELMDPDRQLSEAAARLAGPGQSFLFPKLTWSRRSLKEFTDTPERFEAHLTLVLDAFPIALRVAHRDESDRSSFVHGLIQGAPRRFVGRGTAYSWIRRPAPTPCPDLGNAPGRSGLFAGLISRLGSCQARSLAPGANAADASAVTALDLTTQGQSLLYSAHAVSTWVLTLDPHLGLDYYDAAGQIDRPGYLLDFSPEFVATGGRQLLLTTRASEEVARLMRPALSQLNLELEGPGSRLLVEALRSLSGRLALKLMSSPSQVQGALGMALSRMFLESYGLLSNSIVVPLDAHPELSERRGDPLAPNLRGDLLIVSADPSHRHLDFLLVEAKCHSGSGLPSELRDRISSQLNSNEQALRETFQPAEESDRIDRVMQSWQLSQVLDFYLDRALRYDLVDAATYDSLRRFFVDLDAGYELAVRKIGLVFRLDSLETYLDTEIADVPIWVIGRDVIDRVVAEGLRALMTTSERKAEQVPQRAGAERPKPPFAMSDQPTWDDVRRSFTGPRPTGAKSRLDDDKEGVPESEAVFRLPQGASSQEQAAADPSQDRASVPTPDAPDSTRGGLEQDDLAPVDASMPAYDVLLGDTKRSPQFGLIGSIAAEHWRRVALDLNGCNTISVFGVQGGGKSYTLGSIIEMAAMPIGGINHLPKPLATVVFHYHQTQDYPPEFVSMAQPNQAPSEVRALEELGAIPSALDEVVILASSDTVELRRHEFPGVTVEPISFASSELTVADWRFLMGATGNDALYLKLVNEVMRKNRGDLTLAAIQHGLQDVALTDVQRMLAMTRLEFAARFIDDSKSLRQLLRPGRLIVVDLRDEFIERDQALGLFVTMLNVFSGAGMGEEAVNKLIVFDEAHKYMGGELMGQVVEVIREMRHKGTSVVIASQDPINLPSAVIELSSAVVLHRFNSPNWLKHVQKALAALADLTPPMLASLSPGEAFVWASRSTDPVFTRRALKLRMRPRATRHGGSTRTAVGDRPIGSAEDVEVASAGVAALPPGEALDAPGSGGTGTPSDIESTGSSLVGSVTLHDELRDILEANRNQWMTTQELADEVNGRGRYRKKDRSEVSAFQIHGRTKNYESIFEREGSRVRLLRAGSSSVPSLGEFVSFVDDDEGYLTWLRDHREGFVLNCKRTPTPDYVVLHKATCPHISMADSSMTSWTNHYIKVCSEARDVLTAWANQEVGGQVRSCKSCLG
jgi:DNA phosphorothioation-dependent restriction protein DptH